MKLNEGFNDPSLSVAVILGMNSSKTVKTQRRGRVLRAQEGKVVEIFNLVIKGTVEEQWFQNSVGSNNYVTIDEENLVNLLEGKDFTKKKNKQTSMLFRF
jgi:superfamily II DNA or RNA helicase